MRRKIAVIVVSAVSCLAVVAGGAAVAWHYARPRLQAVAAAEPSADLAIADVVGAAGDQAAVTVTEMVAITDCQRTPFARGHLYTRTANLYTDAGAEDALIGRIATGLPPAFEPSRANPVGARVAPLHAHIGSGVQLTVQVISPGWISATAETDCRATVANPAVIATGAPPTELQALFARLGATTSAWHTVTVPCHGGAITTTDASSTETNTAGIAARLAPAVRPGARRYSTPGNRIVWRVGTTSTVVESSDDGTHVTAQITTTSC